MPRKRTPKAEAAAETQTPPAPESNKPNEPAAPAGLLIAEFRLAVEYTSMINPVSIHGLRKPQYHFFKAADGMHFERRYVTEGVNPDAGRYPLAQARQDLDDLQSGNGLARLRFRVEWLQPDEANAEAAAVIEETETKVEEDALARNQRAIAMQNIQNLQHYIREIDGGEEDAVHHAPVLQPLAGQKPDEEEREVPAATAPKPENPSGPGHLPTPKPEKPGALKDLAKLVGAAA